MTAHHRFRVRSHGANAGSVTVDSIAVVDHVPAGARRLDRLVEIVEHSMRQRVSGSTAKVRGKKKDDG
jgi:hypothetical protein